MYLLFQHIPYEQDDIVAEGSLDDIKAFLKTRKNRNRIYLDDFYLYRDDVPDLHKLQEEADAL